MVACSLSKKLANSEFERYLGYSAYQSSLVVASSTYSCTVK
jgi:hypothetical protein